MDGRVVTAPIRIDKANTALILGKVIRITGLRGENHITVNCNWDARARGRFFRVKGWFRVIDYPPGTLPFTSHNAVSWERVSGSNPVRRRDQRELSPWGPSVPRGLFVPGVQAASAEYVALSTSARVGIDVPRAVCVRIPWQPSRPPARRQSASMPSFVGG